MDKHKQYVETVSLILRQANALEQEDNESALCDGINCANCPAHREAREDSCRVLFFRNWWFFNIIEKNV